MGGLESGGGGGGGGSGVQSTVLFGLGVTCTVCLSVFPPPGNAGGETVVNCVTGFLDVITAVVTGGVMNKRAVERVSLDAAGRELKWGPMVSITLREVLGAVG